MSDTISVQPFGGEHHNNRREFTLYGAHGEVELTKHIDVDLADFIQALEPLVCGRIGRGVRIPHYSAHIKVTPELIRSRSLLRPIPEARGWIWLFLNCHPDFCLSQSHIANVYRRDHTTVRTYILQLRDALVSNRKLETRLQEIADELLIQSYAPFTIARYARAL